VNSDLLTFISGRIPLGIALPLMAGAFGSFVWWAVWAGTQFWERRQLWNNLARIWILACAAYLTAWFLFPPPPIPLRVVVVETLRDSTDWRTAGVAEMIRDGLRRTHLPFVLLDEDICPGLKAVPDAASFDRLALTLNIKWQVVVDSVDPDLVLVTIRKRGSHSYITSATLQRSIQYFRRDGTSLAAEALGVLGEKHPPAISNYQPPDCPDSILAIMFAPPGSSDSSAVLCSERLRSLAESHPDWQAAQLLTAKSLMRLGFDRNRDEILTQLEEAGRLDVRDPETMTLLGMTFLEFHQWEQAESALKLSYNLNPSDPRTLFYLSRLEDRRLVDMPYKSSLRLLERCLYLNPGYEDARLELSSYYLKHRDKPLARKVLVEGLNLNSQSEPLRQSLAAALIETGNYEEAVRICHGILEINPNHAPTYYNLGIAYLYLKRYEEAMAALDSSLARGGTVNNFYYKGVAYQKMGQWDKAIKEFQRRMASPQTSDDKVAISARERVKMLRRWIVERDSGKTN